MKTFSSFSVVANKAIMEEITSSSKEQAHPLESMNHTTEASLHTNHEELTKIHNRASPHKRSVIFKHTSDPRKLNRALRTDSKLSSDQEETVHTLDNSMHPIPHDISIHLGLSHNPDKHLENGKGKIKSYISGSLDSKVGHSFAKDIGERNSKGNVVKHIAHYHLRKGQHALYAAPHSSDPDEKEVILPRNSTIHKIGTVHKDNGEVHHHFAVES